MYEAGTTTSVPVLRASTYRAESIVTIRLPLPGLVPVTESKKDSKAA